MSPQVTAAVIAASVGVLTVIATVAVQISGRRATSRDTQKALEEQRKQLDRTLAEQRTRTLNERFATAAGQLGDDKPAAVRLAGVYAMAGLADDWPENRQTCVDVLCAYLRLPYEPDPGEEAPGPERLAFRASREIRHTVIRVITAHLQEDARRCPGRAWTSTSRALSLTAVTSSAPGSPAAWSASSAPGSPAARSASARAKFSGGTVRLRRAPSSPAARSASTAPSSPAVRSTSTAPCSPAARSASTTPVLRRRGQLRRRRVRRRPGSTSAPCSPAAKSASDGARFSGGEVSEPSSPAAGRFTRRFSGGRSASTAPCSPAAGRLHRRRVLRRQGQLHRRRVLRR